MTGGKQGSGSGVGEDTLIARPQKSAPLEEAATVAAAFPDAGAEVHGMLLSSGALLEGHYLLSSGLHSPRYVQCAKLLELPQRARRVGERLAALLAKHKLDSIVSPALGGMIIGHEVAAALGIPFRFTERKDGTMEMRRGFTLRKGERVAVVEDVVTTGKSTLEAAAVATAQGAEVVAVGAIIDRSGRREPLTLPFESLLRLEFPTWLPAVCPLCAEGGKAEKPGSRA